MAQLTLDTGMIVGPEMRGQAPAAECEGVRGAEQGLHDQIRATAQRLGRNRSTFAHPDLDSATARIPAADPGSFTATFRSERSAALG